MKKTLYSILLIVCITVLSVSNANATSFWKGGKIKKILVDDTLYGGCMVQLDSAIGNSCNASWVSLDCKGLFNAKSIEAGKQRLSTAVAAAHNGRTISMLVNSNHRVNGYCVARRIDTFF